RALVFTLTALPATVCAVLATGCSSLATDGVTARADRTDGEGRIVRTIERSWPLGEGASVDPADALVRTTTFDAEGREIRVDQVDRNGPGSFLLCTAHLEDGSELSVLWEGFDPMSPDYEREIPRALDPPRKGPDGAVEVRVHDAYYGSDVDALVKTAEYAFDAEGRMVRRTYFRRKTGEAYAEDVIRYDARGRESGYRSRRLGTDDWREYTNEYGDETLSGEWTSKTTLVDGVPSRRVERTVERAVPDAAWAR
ncbi:MAG: hypothetical protein AAFP86_07750, partial [Planctomycetota bacterium]